MSTNKNGSGKDDASEERFPGDNLPGDNLPGDNLPGENHFDEIDAVRRFPAEEEWLDLRMPELDEPDSSSSKANSDATASFTDRVMQARQDEQQINEELASLESALPNVVLQQYAPPEPSPTFVESTVTLIQESRRQQWQEMLARYVAPEPSTAFVSKTLAALHATDAQTTNRGARNAAPQNWPVFSLVAAAAAAIFWLLITDDAIQPLELRLADQASPAVAYQDATTPMAAILARIADDDEPFALFDEPADGLWLTGSTGEVR
jgi:hypothetical protein